MSNVVLSSLHLIVLGTCDTGGSTPHLHVALPIGCMPSPKTSRPSASAGELTVGSFKYGVLLLQATRLARSEEHTSELQSHVNLVCRLPLEKIKTAPLDSRTGTMAALEPVRTHAAA